MKETKTSYPPIIIGTSFMLVLFIILCMVVFSILSLSTTMKDFHHSLKTVERTTNYYNANNEAEEVLAQIDAILINGNSPDKIKEELLLMDGLSVTSIEGTSDFIVEYAVSISETKILQVILTTHTDQTKRYTVTTWKQISVADWTGNQNLPVLGSK